MVDVVLEDVEERLAKVDRPARLGRLPKLAGLGSETLEESLLVVRKRLPEEERVLEERLRLEPVEVVFVGAGPWARKLNIAGKEKLKKWRCSCSLIAFGVSALSITRRWLARQVHEPCGLARPFLTFSAHCHPPPMEKYV